jgi:hypothetical protein
MASFRLVGGAAPVAATCHGFLGRADDWKSKLELAKI